MVSLILLSFKQFNLSLESYEITFPQISKVSVLNPNKAFNLYTFRLSSRCLIIFVMLSVKIGSTPFASGSRVPEKPALLTFKIFLIFCN